MIDSLTQAPTSPIVTSSLIARWGALLYEVSRQFSSSLELDEVLSQVLSLTVETIGATGGSIFLLSDEGRVERSILARKELLPERKHSAVSKVMTQGFAGWVYRHRRGDIIYNTQADQRWYFFPDDSMVTHSAMAVPLMRRDKIIGIMTMMQDNQNGFSPRHLALLEIIAAQAASAIENATIYTQVNNERLKLQAIISGVQDIIFVLDRQERLILANPAAERQLGLSKEGYGQPLKEVLPQKLLVEFSLSTAESGHTDSDIILSDERVFHVSLVHIPEVGKVIGMHDITAFKRLDALKNEFVAHVSHDLKAPLAVIQGYVWLLSQMPDLNHEASSYVQQISGAAGRMLNLISNLLDIARIEMGIETEFQVINLSLAISNAVNHLRPLAEDRGVALDLFLPEETLPVRGSPLRLEQAVTNLINNALKFTPSGGAVIVRAATEDGQPVVRVTDTGPGIPAHMQPRLFQKFSRLGQKSTRENEGHGLGLAIVRSVIEAHEGQVWIESEVGKGSTFVLAFPLVPPEA